MGYFEHRYAGCRKLHDAGFWYRDTPAGREYLCGAKFNKLGNKSE
jgi:hypothetical protein